MSKPVSRIGDLGSGHSCFPPNAVNSGSNTVLTNNRKTATINDTLNTHCCGLQCHGSRIIEGQYNVKVNGKNLSRITSRIDCGEVMMTGSSNVMTGRKG